MSATSTVVCIAISRMVMQRWAEIERDKAVPFKVAEDKWQKELSRSVVASHHQSLRENRPVRRAYAKQSAGLS